MIIFLQLKTNWLILCDHALENLASQACEDRVSGKWARKLGWGNSPGSHSMSLTTFFWPKILEAVHIIIRRRKRRGGGRRKFFFTDGQCHTMWFSIGQPHIQNKIAKIQY